jgi:hypothetical protein
MLRNTSPEKIAGTVVISRIGDLLIGQGFIRYETPAASPGRLAVHLDRRSAPRVLSLVSPELMDYLSAFLAPAATGEALTTGEYLDLAASVYGKAVAGEIAGATISVVMAFPGQVQSVSGGRPAGREARFDIPLVDLLVLEKPFDCEVTWR